VHPRSFVWQPVVIVTDDFVRCASVKAGQLVTFLYNVRKLTLPFFPRQEYPVGRMLLDEFTGQFRESEALQDGGQSSCVIQRTHQFVRDQRKIRWHVEHGQAIDSTRGELIPRSIAN